MATILIAEDEEEILANYERSLTALGHRVVKAKDGAEAAFRAKNQKFDIIISDLDMPKLAGAVLVQELYEATLVTKCPLIFISGVITEKLVAPFKEYKRIRFVSKPASITDIFKKVTESIKNDRKNGE